MNDTATQDAMTLGRLSVRTFSTIRTATIALTDQSPNDKVRLRAEEGNAVVQMHFRDNGRYLISGAECDALAQSLALATGGTSVVRDHVVSAPQVSRVSGSEQIHVRIPGKGSLTLDDSGAAALVTGLGEVAAFVPGSHREA